MRDQTRQAFATLHSLSGVIASVLLVMVFWTGTLLVFDKEIDRWMLPETRLPAVSHEASVDTLLEENRARLATAAGYIQIRRPTPREPFVQFRFTERATGATIVHFVDPATARPLLTTTDKAGTSLLFALHYQLNITSSELGYWIVGALAILLLVLMISGIAVHRKLIDEYFVYRAGKKARRRLLDLHNLTSLVALPFNVFMPLTGLYIVFALLLPAPLSIAAQGDQGRLDREIYGGASTVPPGEPATGTSIDALIDRAEAVWRTRGGSGRADRLELKDLGTEGATLVVAEAYPADAVTISRRAMTYALATGQLLDDFEATPIVAAHGWLTGLHFVQFDHDLLRWLYFLAGLCGTAMIVTGLLFWLEARRRSNDTQAATGYRIVEATTIAGTTGLLAATAALLVANRLIDYWLNATVFVADLEQLAFFGVWGLALVHATVRRGRAWSDQMIVIALLAITAVALNGMTTGDYPPVAIERGRVAVFGVDLVLLMAGLAALIFGLRLRWRAEEPARPTRGRQGAA